MFQNTAVTWQITETLFLETWNLTRHATSNKHKMKTFDIASGIFYSYLFLAG